MERMFQTPIQSNPSNFFAGVMILNESSHASKDFGSLVLNMLCVDWTLSTYTTESVNNACSYLYSFSFDPAAAVNIGARYGNHTSKATSN